MEEVSGITDQVDSAEDLNGVDTDGNLCSSPVDLLETIHVSGSGFHLDFQAVSLDDHSQGWLDVHPFRRELLQ